jgi:RNA polymerase sigma-70 factor, ECF subfamily
VSDVTAHAAARGDDTALATLIRAYHDRVYRYGRRVCRDGFDADDAVQEAFVRLARRPDVQRHRGALAWLFTTVRRTCLRLMRPFRRERRALGARIADDVAAATLAAPTETADRALERWELVHRVHAAIARLERPSREVLVLRDLEGLSGEATARALGLELAAMKTRLHRARAQLRAALQPGEGGT